MPIDNRTIRPIESDDNAILQSMRNWIATHLPEKSQYRIVFGKINAIETALAGRSIKRQDTWKQKALGVALGDALCQQLQYLKWVSVLDDQGKDFGLQWKQTDVIVFPLSEFSIRIKNSEPVVPHDIFRAYVDLFERHYCHVA